MKTGMATFINIMENTNFLDTIDPRNVTILSESEFKLKIVNN